MNRTEWLSDFGEELRRARVAKDDRRELIALYSETVDDRIESGMTEEDAVSSLGDAAEAAAQASSDLPAANLLGSRLLSESAVANVVVIVLLVLGFPLWGSLLLAAACLVVAALIAVLALLLALWVLSLSFIASGVVRFLALCQGVSAGLPLSGVYGFGLLLALAGIGLLSLPIVALASARLLGLIARMGRKVSGLFFRKSRQIPNASSSARASFSYPRLVFWVSLGMIACGSVSALIVFGSYGFDPSAISPLPPVEVLGRDLYIMSPGTGGSFTVAGLAA